MNVSISLPKVIYPGIFPRHKFLCSKGRHKHKVGECPHENGGHIDCKDATNTHVTPHEGESHNEVGEAMEATPDGNSLN